MILLDGKKLAEKILNEVRKEVAGVKKKLRLAIVVLGNDPVVKSFIEKKKEAAKSVGIDVRVYPFPETITTNELRKRIAEIVHEKKNTGVIIQLSLPEHINRQYILNSVTPEKDVDVLSARSLGNFISGKSLLMPPVAGAAMALFDEYSISYQNKHVTILGAGALVGKPTALWLLREHVSFSMITSKTATPALLIREADIIIAGIGKPKYVTGDMVKEGAVVIDAGTSESKGKIVGDVDFESVLKKASALTPVPGGVGPLTVAMLLKNLVILAKKHG